MGMDLVSTLLQELPRLSTDLHSSVHRVDCTPEKKGVRKDTCRVKRETHNTHTHLGYESSLQARGQDSLCLAWPPRPTTRLHRVVYDTLVKLVPFLKIRTGKQEEERQNGGERT